MVNASTVMCGKYVDNQEVPKVSADLSTMSSIEDWILDARVGSQRVSAGWRNERLVTSPEIAPKKAPTEKAETRQTNPSTWLGHGSDVQQEGPGLYFVSSAGG